ncbi:hypothetical protein ROA7023_02957 [Roseisalinus antarcticus]|uniref:Uncharacterized protein n=1 Tax=Roseisalinus antarcticus TaxID=254357 RepID=A0A1Y5TFQ4_9RHOB|nr:hypothetical protein ROA7023_02957 [Roseisalinus antarcticus]
MALDLTVSGRCGNSRIAPPGTAKGAGDGIPC